MGRPPAGAQPPEVASAVAAAAAAAAEFARRPAARAAGKRAEQSAAAGGSAANVPTAAATAAAVVAASIAAAVAGAVGGAAAGTSAAAVLPVAAPVIEGTAERWASAAPAAGMEERAALAGGAIACTVAGIEDRAAPRTPHEAAGQDLGPTAGWGAHSDAVAEAPPGERRRCREHQCGELLGSPGGAAVAQGRWGVVEMHGGTLPWTPQCPGQIRTCLAERHETRSRQMARGARPHVQMHIPLQRLPGYGPCWSWHVWGVRVGADATAPASVRQAREVADRWHGTATC